MSERSCIQAGDYEQEVAQFFEAEKPGFFGSFLIARTGTVLVRGARGSANIGLGVRNQPSTKFRIGSLTKQFTAVAILKLVDAGLLDLEDPFVRYLPDSPREWSGITLRMLLNHSSGIANYTSLPGFESQLSKVDRSPSQVIDLVREIPLEFQPGASAAYSNTGYTLLGSVIEVVADTTYADYLRLQLFDPLGMTSTGYDDGKKIISGMSSGYILHDKVWSHAPYISMQLPFAAGGLYSTVDDLLIWQRQLHSGKLLSEQSLSAMFRDYGHGLGLGIMLGSAPRKMVTHGGGVNGYLSWMARLVHEEIDVIVLSNNGTVDPVERADPVAIAEALVAIALNMPPESPIFHP
jgi:CubicO group peptidase (beta-lactamase class C family)